MSLLRYVSHPEVVINPHVPVPEWDLSDVGRERTHRMLQQPWVTTVTRVVSSGEGKARQTAAVLADHLGLTVEIRPDTGEVDRSSTGYVPDERHTELANQLFAQPEQSADGWERAIDAQQRMVTATIDLVAAPDRPDGLPPTGEDGDRPTTVLIGHGGVGTLLYCHLAGLEIARHHDQDHPGHYWTFDRRTATMVHHWKAIDADLV